MPAKVVMVFLKLWLVAEKSKEKRGKGMSCWILCYVYFWFPNNEDLAQVIIFCILGEMEQNERNLNIYNFIVYIFMKWKDFFILIIR